ncbi:hypothetical protein [Nocardia sp. NPDC019255]|uniref:hypothetical protein n=1 Tax=Nocardia sp. NPDC019255 TaxID=3154591 RepID=UPI0033F5E938
MSEVVLTFDVPEQCRETFAHELELLRYQMEPVVAWLQRHGGGMEMGGSKA